ncbi:Putative ER degradation enhancer, mannosidase alpha-like 1 [Rhizopus microsporus]|nr:Putative ER degradation enhancer, mannosidase alpha-like 1 [Rhizopus microsporus]
MAMTEERRLQLKDLSKEMFEHGWSSYIEHAFPDDELNPFECRGRGSDKANPDNINVNDVLGDYSLTLVDTLDTLAIIGTRKQFEEAVKQVIETVSFHQNNKVQVFELNIRALGGLLSTHMLITDPELDYSIEGYKDELLHLAVDLANRLMPAFNSTKTGIPYPRVNLQKGVPPTETTETCTAGAGSLILEFGLLSRLTGDPAYEEAAKRALKSVWNRRSHLSLMGNVIDIQTGNWIHTASSTGAGIDSVFEYMLKAYILFGEDEYLDMFEEAYRALMIYVRDSSGYIYRNVHMSTGSLMSYWIDSLSAFFPGLQVLYGDIHAAIKNHLVFYNIWRRYHALPERFDFYQKRVNLPYYPLRPEFIESTYYLYQATKDPFYLDVGEMVIQDLNNRTRLACGFASIGDVESGKLEDRMESFMLSETLKYLYLLFDTEHPFNKRDSNAVFTTEGHWISLPQHYLRRSKTTKQVKNLISIQSNPFGTCPRYNPLHYKAIYTPGHLDMTSIPYQPQADYAAHIAGYAHSPLPPLSINGYCDSPWTLARNFNLSFGSIRRPNSVIEILGDYLIKSLSGLKIEFVSAKRNDGFFIKGG